MRSAHLFDWTPLPIPKPFEKKQKRIETVHFEFKSKVGDSVPNSKVCSVAGAGNRDAIASLTCALIATCRALPHPAPPLAPPTRGQLRADPGKWETLRQWGEGLLASSGGARTSEAAAARCCVVMAAGTSSIRRVFSVR